MKYSSKNSGISLMETVIYAALVSVLSILVVQAILSLTDAFRAIRITRELSSSGLGALDRLGREIRLADSVNDGSIWNATSSKLVLDYAGSITKEFSLADGALHLFENSEDSGPLTSANVEVTNFYVEQATTTSKTAIRISLTLIDKRSLINQKTVTFYTAASMRGLY